MSIDVLWEEMEWTHGGPGPAPTRVLDIVPDEQGVVEYLLSDLDGLAVPYLRFISHETVTIFHQQQLAQLIGELEALGARQRDPRVAQHLRAVVRLVSVAVGSKDTLIAFRVRRPQNHTLRSRGAS